MAKVAKVIYFSFAALISFIGIQLDAAGEAIKSSSNIRYFLYQSPEYPRDCREAINQCSSNISKSGVYLIKPDQYPEPFQVYCENNLTSGGWTVIQRRFGGSISFSRTWNDYKVGFGFLGSEFWIGNERLAHITNQKKYMLRIDLENTEGQSYYLIHENFRIADEWDNYSLSSIGINDGASDVPITWCNTNKDSDSDNICERSCGNPNACIPLDISEPERCICQGNFMIHEGRCIPKEQCGCYDQDNDVVLEEGESFLNSDCSLRTSCTNNTLIKDGYRCGDDATCETTGGVTSCNCNEWFEGDGLTCTRSGPLDCHDLYIANRTIDNTYTIYPAEGSGFKVYCDMTNGGWTILQKRTGSSISFYRDWEDYKNGFGDPNDDHWLGNDKIYSLTNQKTYQLYIEKTNTGGSKYHTRYSRFSISNEGQKYELSLGGYRGNAGNNAMEASSGYRFSTRNQDNDGSSDYDCAEKHRGGWWYPDDSDTGTTEHCYTFSNRVDTGRYEYSDCGCYYACDVAWSDCGTYGCDHEGCRDYYRGSCDGRDHLQCTQCDQCRGHDDHQCCRNKNRVYETTFYSCGYSNLNGDYRYNDARGIFWKSLHGSDCGITTTTMKIRPT